MDEILKSLNYSTDIITREITILNKKINIIYNETLTDNTLIKDFIIKPISSIIINNKTTTNLFHLIKNTLTSSSIKIINYNEIIDKIFQGNTIIIIDNNYIAVETKAKLDRGITSSDSEVTITGSKDAFNENYNTNIGLIRRRIRSSNLVVNDFLIGKQTKTKIGICYMQNICDKSLVEKIKKELNKINIDGILDSSYISKLIIKKDPIFPIINNTQRPDLASIHLLEGKIIIIVDNSPYVLIIPSFFTDFLHTPDDYYDKNINTTFIRIIRLIGFFMSIFLPAFYISITTHNTSVIPYTLLVNFASQRTQVPFPAFIEALILIISFEILRESDVRIPSKMGTSISILGGLVLGDAAVSAGIISPIMIIVIAISAISGLIFTNTSLIYTIRYYRIFLLFLATFFGIYGLFIGFIILITRLSSISSFGYPYMAPISPLIKEEITDSIIKLNKNKIIKRNPLIAKKNLIRGKKWKKVK